MVIGVNRVQEHDGRQFHIQAEDLGLEAQSFEVRVYEAGTVLWTKRVSYADELVPERPRPAQEEAIRSLMEKIVHTVQAAIAKGKLGS